MTTTEEHVDSVADVLAAIHERDGELTAEQVVAEAAANPDSPLHTRFEWDNSKAAHQYRLEQARSLIRSYTLTVEDNQVRRFVYIKSTESYQPFDDVVANTDWRAEMISDFEREAKRFQARWRTHKAVAGRYAEWLHEQLAEVA